MKGKNQPNNVMHMQSFFSLHSTCILLFDVAIVFASNNLNILASKGITHVTAKLAKKSDRIMKMIPVVSDSVCQR